MPEQRTVDVWVVNVPLPGHIDKCMEICRCDSIQSCVAVVTALLACGEKAHDDVRIKKEKDIRFT